MLDFNDAPAELPQDSGVTRESLRTDLVARLESVLATLFPAGKKRKGKFLIGDVLGSQAIVSRLSLMVRRPGCGQIVRPVMAVTSSISLRSTWAPMCRRIFRVCFSTRQICLGKHRRRHRARPRKSHLSMTLVRPPQSGITTMQPAT